jgi:hypothetical protein
VGSANLMKFFAKEASSAHESSKRANRGRFADSLRRLITAFQFGAVNRPTFLRLRGMGQKSRALLMETRRIESAAHAREVRDVLCAKLLHGIGVMLADETRQNARHCLVASLVVEFPACGAKFSPRSLR